MASLDYNHQKSHVAADGTGGYMETMGNSKGNNGLMENNCGNYYGNNTYGNNTGTNYGKNYGNITETNHGNHGNIMGTYGNCGPVSGSGFHVNEGNNQPRETDVIIGSVTPQLVESTFCSDVMESVKISSFQVNRHSSPTPETVSRLWNVGLETAQRMLRATTQQGIHSAVYPIIRHYTYISTGRDCTRPFTLTRYFQKLFHYEETNVHRFSRMAHSRQCTPSCQSHTRGTPFGNSSMMLEFQTGYMRTFQRNIRERTQSSNNRYVSSISKCIMQKRGERTRITALNERSGY